MKISVAVTDTPGPFSPMLYGDLDTGLSRAATLAYDAVELFLLDPVRLGTERIADAVNSQGLSVSAIGPGLACYRNGWTFVHPEVEVRRRALDRLFDHIRLAAQWSTSVNVGGIRGRMAEDPVLRSRQQKWLLECVRISAEFAESHGVSLAIEPINRYETNYINRTSEALEFLQEVDRPNVGVLLDTFHMNIEEQSIEGSIALAKGRILNVHLPDSNRRAPGWGHLNLDSILKSLISGGYDSFLSMELLPLPTGEDAAVQSIRHVRSLLSGLQGRSDSR